MKPLAVYLHVPFCRSKCIYCDFASWPNGEARIPGYLTALKQEMRAWQERLRDYEASTVFLGGGTPTILSGEQIADLLDALRSTVAVRADAEITMEANPGTVDDEQLRICREAGVNRISLGAQAMDDALLRRLGRIHAVRDVEEAVRMARAAGFDNLSLDLMYGLPEQRMEHWRETLERAVALKPEHLSAYSLIVEEGTPMFELARSGTIGFPNEDETIEMQRAAIDRLASAGYHRYEISNYAQAGRECRHNIVYWQRGEYLGLGCAAHSLFAGERFENPRDLEAYLGGARKCNVEVLSAQDAMEETLMLSTRMLRGMDLKAYRRDFGVDFEIAHARAVERMRRMKLIEIEDGFLRLTRSGLEVQNAVVLELLGE